MLEGGTAWLCGFRAFIEIARNPHSQAVPPSNNGGQYINSFGDFSQSVEAGRTKDLHRALKDLDEQIDADNVQSEN